MSVGVNLVVAENMFKLMLEDENECENTPNVPKVAFVPGRRYCTCRSGTLSATQD